MTSKLLLLPDPSLFTDWPVGFILNYSCVGIAYFYQNFRIAGETHVITVLSLNQDHTTPPLKCLSTQFSYLFKRTSKVYMNFKNDDLPERTTSYTHICNTQQTIKLYTSSLYYTLYASRS